MKTTTERLVEAYALGSANPPDDDIVETGEEESQGIFSDFMRDPSTMPTTIAQQIFSIVPGIAGGIAGFWLATRLAKSKRVKTKGVAIASVAVAVLTFGSILIVEADEIESAG